MAARLWFVREASEEDGEGRASEGVEDEVPGLWVGGGEDWTVIACVSRVRSYPAICEVLAVLSVDERGGEGCGLQGDPFTPSASTTEFGSCDGRIVLKITNLRQKPRSRL